MSHLVSVSRTMSSMEWCGGRARAVCSKGSSLSWFFFSSRRRHTRYWRDWSSDVCSSDLPGNLVGRGGELPAEGLLELLVQPQDLVALAGTGVEPHQTRVRLLVRRLARHSLQERLDGEAVIPASFIKGGQLGEQGRVRPPEFLPLALRPILVAIARQ